MDAPSAIIAVSYFFPFKLSILPVQAFLLSSAISMHSSVVHYACTGHCCRIAPVFSAVRLSSTSVH